MDGAGLCFQGMGQDQREWPPVVPGWEIRENVSWKREKALEGAAQGNLE